MEKKQVIIHDDIEIGYLPWVSGKRLGAVRWKPEFILGIEKNVEIKFSKKIGNVTLNIGDILKNMSKIKLPSHTDSSDNPLYNEFGVIKWELSENSGNSKIIQNDEDWELSVNGEEGENIILIAYLNDNELRRFFGTIGKIEKIIFPSFKLVNAWEEGEFELNMSFLKNPTKDNPEKCEYSINEGAYKEVPVTKSNFIEFKIKNFDIGLLDMNRDCQLIRVKYTTSSNILIGQTAIEYDFNFDKLKPIVSLTKNLFDLKNLEQMILQSPNDTATTMQLKKPNFEQSRITGTFDLDLLINIANKNGKYSLTQMNKENEEFRFTYKRIGELLIESGGSTYISLIPILNGLNLIDLEQKLEISLDIDIKPQIGFKGNEDIDWLTFLKMSQLEKQQAMVARKISFDSLIENKYLENMSQGVLESMKNRHLYRMINKSGIEELGKNDDETEKLLNKLLEINIKNNKLIINNEKEPYRAAQKIINEHYTGNESHLPIDVGENKLNILNPFQSFKINEDSINDAQVIGNKDCFFSINVTKRKEIFSKNPISHNHSIEIFLKNGNINMDLYSLFSFKKRNQMFTAPRKPGLYYLIGKDTDGDFFLLEIEVRSFKGGD